MAVSQALHGLQEIHHQESTAVADLGAFELSPRPQDLCLTMFAGALKPANLRPVHVRAVYARCMQGLCIHSPDKLMYAECMCMLNVCDMYTAWTAIDSRIVAPPDTYNV